jgi:hypothetical protein
MASTSDRNSFSRMYGQESNMKAKLAVLLTFFLVPHLAGAQTGAPTSRFELRGSGGWIGFPDEGMIHHALAGVSVRIGLAKRLGLEPELTYMKGPGEDRDVVLTPVVSYEFGSGRVRPYVLGAAGVLWHRDRFQWGSGYHVSGGFGIRTQINGRWSISPEFRIGAPPHLQFKAGVGYRF